MISHKKRKILLIISILTFSICYGQYDWTTGTLILKNGETLKGLIKIPMVTGKLISIGKSKLEFKKDIRAKKQKFGKTQVNKVYFGSFGSDYGYYEYVPINRKKMSLFKLIRNGKVKLYIRTKRITVKNKPYFPYNKNRYLNNKIKKIKEYYIIREGESIATRIINFNESLLFKKLTLKQFKNDMLNYFSDCKEMISYIENDIYEEFDIKQIVEDYNLICE